MDQAASTRGHGYFATPNSGRLPKLAKTALADIATNAYLDRAYVPLVHAPTADRRPTIAELPISSDL